MSELKDKDEQYKKYLKLDSEKVSQERTLRNFSRLFKLILFVMIFWALVNFVRDNYESAKMYVSSKFAEDSTPTTQTIARKTVEREFEKVTKHKTRKFSFRFFNRYQNILLLGLDSNGDGTDAYKGVRSDTIVLINVDTKDKVINAISIPRDSKVYISDNHGIQKINAAYALGGIDLTRKTIEETLGVRINNYIIVNSGGVRNLVDALGGVSIYIEKPMHYTDYSGKLFIDLKKGAHVLNGKDAEGYLRFRKDLLGDIGRTYRQQTFLKALLEKLKSPDSIKTIPVALKIANENIKTDMSLYQLSQYAALAREIDSENVTITTLPGAPNKKGHISYWILDPDKTQKVIDSMIYHRKQETDDKIITVGIMYSRDKQEDAMRIKEQLKLNGCAVNCIGRGQFDRTRIIYQQSAISRDVVRGIVRKIPEINSVQMDNDSTKNFCGNSDFTVIIANDYILKG